MSKPKLQARMRALTVDEKVNVLEKLRDRSLEELCIARVFLVASKSVANPLREQRAKLESEAQKYLSTHLKGGAPNSSRTALYALLRAWLDGYGRVRFEVNVDEQCKATEVTSVAQLGSLLGEGQTPGSLLRALGQ